MISRWWRANARARAGTPKLKTLARKTGYSESMLSRIFNGQTVPGRERLEALAEELDASTGDFTEQWLPLWKAASRKEPKPSTRTPSAPAVTPTATEGFPCPSCHGWIRFIDAPAHIEWHMRISDSHFRAA